MPFEPRHNAEVTRLKDEITECMSNTECVARLQSFLWWKIENLNGAEAPEYRLRSRSCAAGYDAMEDGYYLANLVLQGGGMLGLAHTGFIYGLEHAGVRFGAVAATSAGAIVASGLVALRGRDILRSVGDEMTDIVASIPTDTFIDGPRNSRRAIKHYLAGKSFLPPQHWLHVYAALRQVMRTRGLNRGGAFMKWLADDVFGRKGLHTVEDLNTLLNQIATDLIEAQSGSEQNPFTAKTGRGGADDDEAGPMSGNIDAEDLLRLITIAMPTATKFSLPRDLKYLDDEYRQRSPALLARLSMSIPGFFQPYALRTHPTAWKMRVRDTLSPLMADDTAWEVENASSLAFLDGGMFSNLPTDELVANMPEVPTITVPIVSSEQRLEITRYNSLAGLKNDTINVAQSVRLQRDRETHARDLNGWHAHELRAAGNPDARKFPQYIAKIDVGNANWLNFTMSDLEKEELFICGLRRACAFIRKGPCYD